MLLRAAVGRALLPVDRWLGEHVLSLWQSGNFGWISTPCRPPSRNTIAKFRDVAVEFCVSDDLAPITHRVGPFVKTTTFVRTDSFDFPKKQKRNKKKVREVEEREG